MGSELIPWLSLTIAGIALSVSVGNLWFQHLRVGRILITRPTQIYFGPDGGFRQQPKVYMRATVYATSIRGRVLEDLFVVLNRGPSIKVFPIWVHGERGELKRGAGLRIGQDGSAVAHHFLLPDREASYTFDEGRYEFIVMAKTVGDTGSNILYKTNLSITADQSSLLLGGKGIYFDWAPDSQSFVSHVESRELDPEVRKNQERLIEKILS